MEKFLQQNIQEKSGYEESLAGMSAIVGGQTEQ
jgi:hypothetical protein